MGGASKHPPATAKSDGRRLIAVVYADIEGYSRLIGADDAGTFARLQALRRDLIDPLLARHRGTLINTAGDSLLITFDSILLAMRFAVEVQREIPQADGDHAADRRIRFRMGVNVGDVIPDGTNIHGEGVNIAARLQSICPAGTICVSRVVRDQTASQLGLSFTELGPISLKNIAQPVEAFIVDRIGDAEPVIGPMPKTNGIVRGLRHRMVFAASALFICAASGGGVWILTRTPSGQTRTSDSPTVRRQQVAVLPLLTIGGGDEYFAEGLTEDLIAALGRFPEIAVRARGAVIEHKGQSPGEVAQALAVSYVVEGSVRREPDRLRVAVRLIGTQPGVVLWSETYDAEPRDVFAVQDDMTRRIVGALSVRLDSLAVASAMAKPPGRLEAYDLVLRGRHQLDLVTRVGTNQARALFDQAIELDQNYAAAYVGRARTDVTALEEGWTGDPQGTLSRAIASGRTAVTLEPDNPTAHAVLGRALIRAGNYKAGLDELKQAVALNPSDPEALGGYGDALSLSGDPQAGIPFLEEGARFRPNRPTDELIALGMAYFLAGRPKDAARTAEQGMARAAPLPFFSVLLAISYAQLGRAADAAREAENVHLLMPRFDAETFSNFLARPEDRERLRNALRHANL